MADASPPFRFSRAAAARRLGVSVSAIKRWENQLPRPLQVEAKIERLTPATDEHGDHWHDGAQLAAVAAARARMGVRPGPARRMREGELHAAIVVALEQGHACTQIVRDLRAPLSLVLRVARAFAQGAPAGTVIPAALASELSAALGVVGIDPAGWAAAARALRLLVRERKATP